MQAIACDQASFPKTSFPSSTRRCDHDQYIRKNLRAVTAATNGGMPVSCDVKIHDKGVAEAWGGTCPLEQTVLADNIHYQLAMSRAVFNELFITEVVQCPLVWDAEMMDFHNKEEDSL